MEDKQFRLTTAIVEQCCAIAEEGLTRTLLPQGVVFVLRAPMYYSALSPATLTTALPPYIPLTLSYLSHVTSPWSFKYASFNCSSRQDLLDDCKNSP